MTNVPQLMPPSEAKSQQSSGWSLRRILFVSVGSFFALLILLFLLALLIATASDVEGAADVVRLVRDMVIIFLALEGALIILSLAVLILQIARLIAMIQTEIKPILENTQETVRTAKGTVEFMSENITQPMIRAGGFMTALVVFVENLAGLRRAVRRGRQASEAMDEAQS
ncbi:MAG: hypothetical protein CUN53_12675 [Phototrophicales bacterium]|nr:MAG: hypothetical protein CUN53_12675 [Phototrophicales bacterium]